MYAKSPLWEITSGRWASSTQFFPRPPHKSTSQRGLWGAGSVSCLRICRNPHGEDGGKARRGVETSSSQLALCHLKSLLRSAKFHPSAFGKGSRACQRLHAPYRIMVCHDQKFPKKENSECTDVALIKIVFVFRASAPEWRRKCVRWAVGHPPRG